MLTVIRHGRGRKYELDLTVLKTTVAESGLDMKLISLPVSAGPSKIITAIGNADSEPNCSAILVLQPLALTGANEAKVMRSIPPDKDIAGANPDNMIFSLSACSVLRHLIAQGIDNMSGMNVAMFGDTTRKPINDIIHGVACAGATLTIMSETAEERMRFLACRTADIIISQIGIPDVVHEEYINDFSRPKILIDLDGNDISAKAKEFVRKNSSYANPLPNASDLRREAIAELIRRLKEMEGRAK